MINLKKIHTIKIVYFLMPESEHCHNELCNNRHFPLTKTLQYINIHNSSRMHLSISMQRHNLPLLGRNRGMGEHRQPQLRRREIDGGKHCIHRNHAQQFSVNLRDPLRYHHDRKPHPFQSLGRRRRQAKRHRLPLPQPPRPSGHHLLFLL